MITFTPLSGAVGTTFTKPLVYLLQVDDVRILLDCGSPDWNPEARQTTTNGETLYPWDEYCNALKECVYNRCQPTQTYSLPQIRTNDRPCSIITW